jgi:hypothetical protein
MVHSTVQRSAVMKARESEGASNMCALETAFDAQVKALESEDEIDALPIPGRVSNAS